MFPFQNDQNELCVYIIYLLTQNNKQKHFQRNFINNIPLINFYRPLEPHDAGEKEEPHDMAPPRFIEVQKGKISLAPVIVKQAFEPAKNKVSQARIATYTNLV